MSANTGCPKKDASLNFFNNLKTMNRKRIILRVKDPLPMQFILCLCPHNTFNTYKMTLELHQNRTFIVKKYYKLSASFIEVQRAFDKKFGYYTQPSRSTITRQGESFEKMLKK